MHIEGYAKVLVIKKTMPIVIRTNSNTKTMTLVLRKNSNIKTICLETLETLETLYYHSHSLHLTIIKNIHLLRE